MNHKFLWGSSTAAYQCEGGWKEGGKGLSNWDVFCHSDKNNVNPVTGDVSSDFYHHYEEDIRMLAEGNQNAYRFSIAWTRIIPDGTGEVSEEGIAFYNNILDTCKKYGVEPLVTLYHYDLPESLFEAGGWENRKTVEAYERYATVCFNAFHTKVKYWITINEPGYETLCCYGFGNYPPNVKNIQCRWCAMYHMMLASARAINAFRVKGYEGQIGLVSDSYYIAILKDNPAYQQAKIWGDLFFNRSVNDICIKGEYPIDFIEKLKKDGHDLKYMLKEDQEVFLNGTVDFLGLNAYDRICVKPYEKGETSLNVNNTGKASEKHYNIVKNWFATDIDPNTSKNAWGMEMYPKSVYFLLKDLSQRYPQIPIIITENGLGFYDDLQNGKIHDQYRIDFLSGYIKWMKEAMKEGCNVCGYFVWSTMDLYSWINGYHKRYGLVYVDYDNNNRRIPKDSYYWYKKMIEEEVSEQSKREKN